jgi:hypothetical protein
MFAPVEIVIQNDVRGLCLRPYPLHPRGCPNYAKKNGCPPLAPLFRGHFDLSTPIFAIWNVFLLGEHIKFMRSRHPAWSERQLRCCLYWQPKARKELRAEIRAFLDKHKGYRVVTCPEAMGVNVTETMRHIGENLEWPPQRYAYQVAIAGKRIEKETP